jgi:prevent-host-death family protein
MAVPTNKRGAHESSGPVQIPASEVKNAWHEYVDRVSQAREVIVVTRYGKPVLKLSPIEEPEERSRLFGWLAGTVTVHGEIVAPSGERWEVDA